MNFIYLFPALLCRIKWTWLLNHAVAGNRRRLFIIAAIGIMQQASSNGLISYYHALIEANRRNKRHNSELAQRWPSNI
jgi:hypothetical protein